MQLQSLKDLFIFRLNQTLSAEKGAQQLFQELTTDARSPQVKDALERHANVIGTQISHLEQCLRTVGAQPTPVSNYVIEGMLKEVGEFKRQNPSVEAFDLYRLGTGIKLAFLKIGTYHVLMREARALGEQDCVRILEGDLREMEDRANKVVDLVTQIGQQWGGGRGPSMGMR